MTVSELQAKIRGDSPTGFYLFCGEEAYLRRSYLSMLRERILTDPDFDTFNHIVHEGAKPDAAALRADLETPPFFADFKLIEWHSAEPDSLSEAEVEDLLELARLSDEVGYAALVIVATPEGFDPGTEKRRSALYRKLEGGIRIVEFAKSGDAALVNWIGRHFAHEKVTASPAVARLLLMRAGHSMDVLANEIDKLCCYVLANGRDTVTEQDVIFVSSSTTEADAFGLTNALLDGNAEEAFYNLRDLKSRRVEPTAILGQVSRLFGDLLSVSLLLSEGMNQAAIAATLSMNAYKAGLYVRAASRKTPAILRRALSLCTDADLTVKTSYGADAYAVLEKLVSALAAL